MTNTHTTSTPRYDLVTTSLGTVTIVATGDAITGIYFSDQRRRPDDAEFGRHVDDDALLDAFLTAMPSRFDIAV